jgi:anti-repressor protein
LEILPFNFENNKIRTILINNEPWFVAKDIAKILEIKNVSDAIKDFDDDEKSDVVLNYDGKTSGKALILSESGLYALILRSRKPITKPFQKWVTKEVLPSIRKTGSYSLQKVESPKPEISISETLSKSVEILHLIQLLKEQKTFDLFLLDGILENESPTKLLKIDFSQKYFLPTELGFLKGMSGAEMNQFLFQKGFQIRDEKGVWKPTENGKEFCLEIGGKFSQLKWKLEVLL